MSKSIQHKWYIKLHCIINDSKNSKNQQFDVEAVPLDCNLIQKDTPVLFFFCEFWQLFQSATLLKMRLHHTWILVSFVKCFSCIFQVFSTCKFIKKTTTHAFSCKFCKIFMKTYFVYYLQTAASNLLLMLDLFIFYCSLKWKIKRYQRLLLCKNVYLSFQPSRQLHVQS